MFGLSLGHLVIVAVVVLLFGHKRLPELGSAMGRGLSAFKKGLEGRGHEEDDQKKLPPHDRNSPDIKA
jgi:sec-independent protein translocase protein TatA